MCFSILKGILSHPKCGTRFLRLEARMDQTCGLVTGSVPSAMSESQDRDRCVGSHLQWFKQPNLARKFRSETTEWISSLLSLLLLCFLVGFASFRLCVYVHICICIHVYTCYIYTISTYICISILFLYIHTLIYVLVYTHIANICIERERVVGCIGTSFLKVKQASHQIAARVRDVSMQLNAQCPFATFQDHVFARNEHCRRGLSLTWLLRVGDYTWVCHVLQIYNTWFLNFCFLFTTSFYVVQVFRL